MTGCVVRQSNVCKQKSSAPFNLITFASRLGDYLLHF